MGLNRRKLERGSGEALVKKSSLKIFVKGCNRRAISFVERETVPVGQGIMIEFVCLFGVLHRF